MATGEKPACRQLSAVKNKTLENISNYRLIGDLIMQTPLAPAGVPVRKAEIRMRSGIP
jgi:hypothetical protein